MAATKRNFNVKSVILSGGLTVTFTGVTNLTIDPRGSISPFSGDGDRFPTTKILDYSDPVLTLESADLAAIRSCTLGASCTVTAIIMDAKNVAGGASSGEISAVLSNAIVRNAPFGAAHRQYARGTVEFESFSSDGVTSPLATTVS